MRNKLFLTLIVLMAILCLATGALIVAANPPAALVPWLAATPLHYDTGLDEWRWCGAGSPPECRATTGTVHPKEW